MTDLSKVLLTADAMYAVGHGVISTDAAGMVQYINSVAEHLTGWSSDEAVGVELARVFHVEEAMMDALYQPSIFDGTDDEKQHRDLMLGVVVARDGQRTPVEISRAALGGGPDDDAGEVIVFRDVSDNQHTQRTLRNQRDLYQSLLRAQSDLGEGCLIMEDEQIVYANDAMCDILGYTEEELYAIPSFYSVIAPDQLDAMKTRHNARISGGAAPEAYETAILRSDGTRVELEVAIKALPGIAARRFIVLARNITERIRAQRDLMQTQLRLTTLFQNLPSVLLYETGGGREYISENVEKLLGFPLEMFLRDRHAFPALMHPDDVAPVDQLLKAWHAAEEPGVVTYQFRVRRADGTYIWLEDHMVEVKPAHGRKYMTGVLIDITERKEAEEELRVAKDKAEEYDRLKTNFISVISHELRTPLNAILGITKLVRNAVQEANQPELEEGLAEYFSIVDRSGDRLMKLVESFLDIASIQAGNLNLKLIDIPVEAVVRNAVDELRLKITEAHLTLVERYEANDAHVHIDAERLTQIITNILANALKFTPRGGITVSTRVEDGNAVVAVEDTGIGISPTFLPNVFTPFRQGSEGATRDYQGAGLGLSIAHRLCEVMGGQIEVASAERRGTTITVRFPVVERAVAPAPAPAPAPPPTATPTTQAHTQRYQRSAPDAARRALVVEDDYENMMYVTTVLRSNGWTVFAATNGEDAMKLIAEHLPQVVLMDMNLVGTMNGAETLAAMRQDDRYAAIPVIAVTAHAFESERQRIMSSGFDDYLAKPFSPDQLREVLARHVVGQIPRA